MAELLTSPECKSKMKFHCHTFFARLPNAMSKDILKWWTSSVPIYRRHHQFCASIETIKRHNDNLIESHPVNFMMLSISSIYYWHRHLMNEQEMLWEPSMTGVSIVLIEIAIFQILYYAYAVMSTNVCLPLWLIRLWWSWKRWILIGSDRTFPGWFSWCRFTLRMAICNNLIQWNWEELKLRTKNKNRAKPWFCVCDDRGMENGCSELWRLWHTAASATAAAIACTLVLYSIKIIIETSGHAWYSIWM